MKIYAKEIDMLAYTFCDGRHKPIRFRLATEEQQEKIIYVDKIIKYELTKKAGKSALIYLCQSEIDGKQWLYELKFKIDKHSWELYKM